jgi:hypothetical protein
MASSIIFILCSISVSERTVLGSVWKGRVSRVRGALGWGLEAARFYDAVRDFVGEDSVFIV